MTAEQPESPHLHYGLVMPFTVCESQGGRLADEPFVIGYELGSLDVRLSKGEEVKPHYVHTDGVPQLDLIAMRHGYSLTTEPWGHDPMWSLATLEKVT